MDRFCDVIVEEILRCLPAKYLHRVRATARRYNLIVLDPGFRARYWESHSPYLSGVFLQSDRPWRQHSRFLASGPSGRPSAATESVLGSDLAFLPRLPPGPTARDREIFIVHATAGLLLCSRGEYRAVQYYVCNPVTWQWAALPELPCRPDYMSGLLSVIHDGDGSSSIKCFRVVLVNHSRHWNKIGGGCMDLKVFSSATGQWEAKRIQPPNSIDVEANAPPFLAQSGTAYWMGYSPKDRLIAYNHLHNTIQTGGVNGVWWKLVHQADVMELAERNPEATALVTEPEYVECRMNTNSLFTVLGIHPTADIIFLDVNRNVAAYSIEHGTIRYQCPYKYFHNDVFPYVHPSHPVEIPAIKKASLELKHS